MHSILLLSTTVRQDILQYSGLQHNFIAKWQINLHDEYGAEPGLNSHVRFCFQ